MKWSQLSISTSKEIPSQSESISQQLMLRAGLIRKNASGVYSYLPLGMRVLHKLNQIIRTEMEAFGAVEILAPILVSKELLCQTDRWDIFYQSVLSVQDRANKEWVLGPTHEENVTFLARDQIKSYKDLPFNWYQISTKFRDEIRPRFGVIRTKEFIMKDAYSFNLDKDCLAKSYRMMREAYTNVFQQCQLNPWILESSSGPMGGESEEFVMPCDIGETMVIECSKCSYTCNLERATQFSSQLDKNKPVSKDPIELIHTPNHSSIEEVCTFLNIEASQTVKSLAYHVEGEDPLLILIRGDLNIDLAKLEVLLGETKRIRPLNNQELEAMNIPAGYLGPLSWPYPKRIWVDYSLIDLDCAIIGANRLDYHYKHFCWRRDLEAYELHNLHLVQPNHPCPDCGSGININRGLELGHIFQLGDKYAKALNLSYVNAKGISSTPMMGCYGIGVNRLMAAIIETHHDENGICWPWNVAPFHIQIVPLRVHDEAQMKAAEHLYQELSRLGYTALLDDRDVRPGVKLKDADLIGMPIRIVLGNRFNAEGLVEIKQRTQKNNVLVSLEHVSQALNDIDRQS